MNKRSGIESRKRIIDAAMHVFSRYGYEKASMRMIAKASDISTGGLYLYFKNKEDLYISLIKDRMNDFAEKTRQALKDIEDPAEAMSTFIAININYAKKHKELILIQGRELGLTFGIDMKRNFSKRQTRLIEDIIRKGIAARVFRDCNVKEAAKIIKGALRGFILSMMIEEDALFSPKECSTLLLKGLTRRDDK